MDPELVDLLSRVQSGHTTCIRAAQIIEASEKRITDGLEARLSTERELRECAEKNLATLAAWLDGTGDGWPLSGHAYAIRKAVEAMCK